MSDKFEKYNRFKVQQKVADLLGMDVSEESELDDNNALVAMPDASEIIPVDNPELPDLAQELVRLEHGQRQQEIILDRGGQAVLNLLNDLDKSPPIYKGRIAETAAELYKAWADLSKARIKSQLEIMDMKMKLIAFVKNKGGTAAPQITGNTIIFNREELIRQFGNEKIDLDDDGND